MKQATDANLIRLSSSGITTLRVACIGDFCSKVMITYFLGDISYVVW